MPKLTRIDENLVTVKITEKEVLELRAIHNCTPSAGEVVQGLINMVMGFDPRDEYFISDVTSAYSAKKHNKINGDTFDGWEYQYKTGSTNSDLIFN